MQCICGEVNVSASVFVMDEQIIGDGPLVPMVDVEQSDTFS